MAAAVNPWASNSMSYQHSHSRGVGARIIRRCKSFTPNFHRSSHRAISLTPIIPSIPRRLSAPSLALHFALTICAFHLGFGLVNLNVAGIDVGASSHFVAVPEDFWEQPVREFEAFTAELYRLANWLTECGVETVAMESTGVYWIPLFGVCWRSEGLR